MTQSNSNMTHDAILQAVLGLPHMKDKTLVHLSIAGSRSKSIASPDSDYDVKAVILHSTENHLLQNITSSKAFATSVVNPDTGGALEVEAFLHERSSTC